MLKRVLLGVAVIIAGILVYAGFKDPNYHFERETKISAPVETVFANINDLHKMNAWNPFMKADPNNKITYEGAASGVGAANSWEGNNDVGAGKLTILESVPNTLVKSKLVFLRPMAGEAVATFSLKSEGGQTSVTWGFDTQSSYLSRLFCVFVNMDKMMAGSFEKGLADLKTIAETAKN